MKLLIAALVAMALVGCGVKNIGWVTVYRDQLVMTSGRSSDLLFCEVRGEKVTCKRKPVEVVD